MDSETGSKNLGLGELASALETSVDAVEIADIEGSVAYVNASWSRLFEWDGRDVAGTAWDLVRADGAEYIEVKKSWNRCIEEGTSQGAFAVSRRDGVKTEVSYVRTLSRDSNGVPFAVVTIYRPISNATTIREPSGLLLALLERRRDGVAVLDEEGAIIAANRPFATLVGYQGSETTGLSFDTLAPNVEEMKSPIRDGVAWWGGGVEVARRDGSSISAWMSMDTVKDRRGKVVGFVVRTKSLGDQDSPGQELVGVPTDPLNRLVHDMRNVFTAIESNLYLALGNCADQEVQRRLAAIREASKRGIELLENADH